MYKFNEVYTLDASCVQGRRGRMDLSMVSAPVRARAGPRPSLHLGKQGQSNDT